MEDFKKKLHRRIWIFRVLFIISIAGIITVYTLQALGSNSPTGWNSGFFAGMLAVSLMNIRRNKKALQDEVRLKQLYILNNDERAVAIARESSKAAFYILMIAVSLGMIVFTYLNQAVSSTLAVVLGVMTIIYLGTHIYYNKKM